MGKQCKQDRWNAKKLIVFSPYPGRNGLGLLCHIDDATIVKTWSETLAALEKDYPGKAKVSVIQDGTMQYMKARPVQVSTSTADFPATVRNHTGK
jgi:hypothetical protein